MICTQMLSFFYSRRLWICFDTDKKCPPDSESSLPWNIQFRGGSGVPGRGEYQCTQGNPDLVEDDFGGGLIAAPLRTGKK